MNESLQAYMPPGDLVFGIDFGRHQSHTAIITIVRRFVPAGKPFEVEYMVPSPDLREAMVGIMVPASKARVDVDFQYDVVDGQRFPLGLDWPKQMALIAAYIKDVRDRLGDEVYPKSLLVPDVTGVGDGVLNELYRALGEAGVWEYIRPHPIFIKSAGTPTRRTDGGFNVSISDLIDSAAVLSQRGLIHYAPDIPLLEYMHKEFLSYKVDKSHRTRADEDSYAGWGKTTSDDCVFGFVLALWGAENLLRRPRHVDLKGLVLVDAPVNVVRS